MLSRKKLSLKSYHQCLSKNNVKTTREDIQKVVRTLLSKSCFNLFLQGQFSLTGSLHVVETVICSPKLKSEKHLNEINQNACVQSY